MEVRTRIQVFKKEFHTHIYLDYDKLKFLYYIKIKNKKSIKPFFFFGNSKPIYFISPKNKYK